MRFSDTLALLPNYYMIHKSGLFDVDYYMETSGPMRRQLLPPQFLMEGSAAEHDPHPLFDTGWHLTRNPDARAISVNPIVHFLRLGASQGWDPNPYFDTKWYLAQNKDVGRAGTNPLVHYLKHGAVEGRDPIPARASTPSGTF
jgi:hypothetical protein